MTNRVSHLLSRTDTQEVCLIFSYLWELISVSGGFSPVPKRSAKAMALLGMVDESKPPTETEEKKGSPGRKGAKAKDERKRERSKSYNSELAERNKRKV